MGEWIDVDSGRRTDRDTQLALVWYERFYGPGFIGMSRFIGGKWEIEREMGSCTGKVTHFMFLPEPPHHERAA